MFRMTGLVFGLFVLAPTGIVAAVYLTVRLNSRR